MPELPEVEVLRRDLEAQVGGSQVAAVTVTGARTVRRHDPALLVDRLVGARLTGFERVGKYLVIALDDGTDALVVHLRMSGQVLLTAAGAPFARHTHAVLFLPGARELRFVDPRTFGELFVTPRPVVALAHLGLDPLGPAFTLDRLASLTAGRRGALKAWLLDQRIVAGLGNIYSDEVLFAAGLRYDRLTGTLSPAEVGRLHGAITATLEAAIGRRGSSLADAQYVDLYGRPGEYQHDHQVYAREDRPCPRCGAPILRRKAVGRSTFFCGTCQS